MKAEYFKDLHIASLDSQSDWHRLKVNTLLQNTDAKQPSINAFLGARYSRSADPVVDIAREVYSSGKDAAKRLEAIFFNYGHKSVGDMADLFLCLENIPIFLAQRFFYLNPVHAGQERSTRYQDFSRPRYVTFPKSLKVSDKIQSEYAQLYDLALSYYTQLKQKTTTRLGQYFKISDDSNELSAIKARVFDTIRYFLPIGLETSIGVVMSARSWAERISYYRASKFSVERELGNLIYDLLIGTDELTNAGYIPEADGLIRHTDPDKTRNSSTSEILEFQSKLRTRARDIELEVKPAPEPHEELLQNYNLLINPNTRINHNSRDKQELIGRLSDVIFKYHDHHHQLGNVAQSGAILIEGRTDYGVLKDLIRHRSFEKFIPLFEENLDLSKEFAREPSDMFRVCDYLEIPQLSDLREEFNHKLSDYYSKVQAWFKLASGELAQETAFEYGRYLLTHGYKTHYKFYGSVDDIAYTIALRTRNGGHIAYRKLTYDWLEELAKLSPLWRGLLEKLVKVGIANRAQFFDRS